MSKFNFIYEDPTSVSQITGSTPHAIYDNDIQFQSESLQVCKYVARKLGHPVMQLEFNSGSIYACLEEAVSEYSQQINHYNTKNWMWEHYGSTTRENFTALRATGSHEPETPNMGLSITLAEQYGEAAGVGGNSTLFSGSLTLTSSKQVYDLATDSTLEGDVVESGGDRIEVQRVFNEGPAAISKFYDPFAGSYDNIELLDSFGMGNVAPAVSYIMRPISFDLGRANAIETNDKIRKSAYSFELVNNKIRLFPRPKSSDDGNKVYFHYYRRDDKVSTTRTYTDGKVLGIIRSKYASMPLPNGEVSLDGESLKAEGREEKANALEELNNFLEAVSLSERSRQEQEQAESQQAVLNKAPLNIYIG